MFKIFPFLSLMIALSACRYESTNDLRSSFDRYSPQSVFPDGRHVFVSADGNQLLTLDVSPDGVSAKHQNGGSSPLNATLLEVLGSDQLPERSFVAFEEGARSETGQKFFYYPFMFNESNIWWMRPSSEVEIATVSDLAQHISTEIGQKRFINFQMVPESQKRIVISFFEQKRAERQQEAQTRNNASDRAPPVAHPVQPRQQAQIKGFTVGDGVYVQGFLSDETALIQDIDTQSQRVKVFRYSDGVSEWVSADRIISRGQSTANDVGRTAVGVAAIVCLLSPDTCKPAQR
ncbi:hypothetical protein EYF88_06995 [Paracoccus sediminis]|uniref:Uncharacterized protein n=1 Tax=Paracoccus sediminis TaxID=1214787 RepID=A0A238W2Y9_9RHOB|nr:hypothetical protein [Paracoccus sediminis]TBN51528.1 hypothetical protein EYF88_06995 [Paracoccus sediminis]SNR40896.1 hypothetical protein SAMN06265378_103311 [Paracoccus sediminis]